MAIKINDLVRTLVVNIIYRVGDVMITYNSANPTTYWPGTTWISAGVGRFFIGVDPSQTAFNAAGKTGGTQTETLTTQQIPPHTHLQNDHDHGVKMDNTGQRLGLVGSSAPGSTALNGTAGTTRGGTITLDPTTAVNQNTGGGQPHNNMPPYETIYKWKRTA